jgi:hypothetical protein
MNNVPNNPPGCGLADTAKPNPSYLCITLKTTPERWQAYGTGGKDESVGFTVIATGEPNTKYKGDVQTGLRQRMATLAFAQLSDVSLEVSDADQGVELGFSIRTKSKTTLYMARLIDGQLSSQPRRTSYWRQCSQGKR